MGAFHFSVKPLSVLNISTACHFQSGLRLSSFAKYDDNWSRHFNATG
jgi:hypothetical protein